MSVLASRRGIALLLVGVVLGLVVNAVVFLIEPVAVARAQIGTEVDVVPLSGLVPGAHGGQAVIYAKIVGDGDVEIGYYEFVMPPGQEKMDVYHSTSKESWDQGAYIP